MKEFTYGEDVATYKFDAQSRRIEKTVGETTTKYEYNGADVIAEYDGDDTLQAIYNTPALDKNLTVKIGEAVYHYLHDGLGSVRNLLDSDETIQNTYDYLAFGSVYGTPTENISNPFRFTSRRWNPESSLHFYRARMMDQTLGRFLSKDPIFNPNLYGYVKNNPIMHNDPSGRVEKPHSTEGPPCYCGPDVSNFFKKLVISAYLFGTYINAMGYNKESKFNWLTDNSGHNFDWWSEFPLGKYNTENCPHGEICANTYWLFGECIYDRWIGNFMIAFVEHLLYFTKLFTYKTGELYGKGPEAPWETNTYEVAWNVLGDLDAKGLDIDIEKSVKRDMALWQRSIDIGAGYGKWRSVHTAPASRILCEKCPEKLSSEVENTIPGGKLGSKWPKMERVSWSYATPLLGHLFYDETKEVLNKYLKDY